MNTAFKQSDWTVVLPKPRGSIFASPFLEPASIVAQETGSELEECFGCGQLREDVVPVVYAEDHSALVEVCGDCRREYGG